MTTEGFQPERCAECGHPIGDHHVVKTGGLRPPAVGGCLLTSCDCTDFTPIGTSSRKEPPHVQQDPSDGHRSHPDRPDVAARPGGSPVVLGRQPLSGDQFVDAVYDGRSERAGDGVGLTQPEAVALSLGAPHGSDLYPYLRDRHPFGLPAPDRARPLTGTPPTPGGTTPTGSHPASPPCGDAGRFGDPLPDAA